MSKEGDRQSVFRSTKIRTALKGDSSWIQRGNPSEQDEEDEKPWLAEVRAHRLNSDFTDPMDDKTPPEPETQPSASVDSNSKSSGYLIRGVFTKTDTKAASSSSNGYMGSSGFVKKSSEGYKKIAPHTVRSTVEKTETLEPSLSSDEQEKRTMAASKTLNSSAGRQKSYVMSAAKKYELTPETTDTSASSTTAFIAKRVVIGEEDDTGFVQPSTRVSPPKQSVEMSVDELTSLESLSATSKLKNRAKPEPTTKQSDTKSTLSDTLLSTSESISKKPVAQVSSPVPETKTVSKPEPSPTKTSTVNEKISQITPVAPVTTLKKSATPEPKSDSTLKASTTEPAIPAVKDMPSKTPETKPKAETTPKPSINPKPVEKTSALNDNDLLDLTGSAPGNLVDPMPPSTDLLTGGVLPKTEKAKKSLDLLADDIIPFDTNTDKLSSDKTSTKIEISKTVVQTKKDVKSTSMTLVDPVPTTTDLLAGRTKKEKTKGSLDLLADDMLQFNNNTNKPSTDKTSTKIEISQTVQTKKDVKSTPMTLVDPVPTTTDLLAGRTKTEKTKGSLGLLADDMLQFDNNTNKPSTDKTSSKIEISQTVQTKKDVKSTPMTLVDPVPTTTDLLAGGSLPKTKKTTETLDLLADDIIPFDTNKDRISTDKTRSKVETTTTVIETKTVKTSSDDPFDPFPVVRESTKSSVDFFDPPLSDSRNGQQQTVSVTYKQTRSTKTSSPWDKWEVPTVDITQEESFLHSEPKPAPELVDDSYSSYTMTEESSFPEPDKTKKNIVYVKSYVNSSEPPRYSSSRYDTDYDYVTSSSSSYAYSSPSSMVTMTSCTYCGKPVGSDSKITIDHLNISCHPECFKCSVCSKPMGDFLHSMFLHRGMVHCENCYSNII